VKPGERLRSRRSRAARSSPRPERAVDAALDHLGALVGVDAGWVVRSATPGLARLIGRPGATAIGRSLRQLLSPASAPATLEALARAAQAPGARVVPARLVGDRPALIVPVPTPEPSAEIYLFVSDALAEPSGAATAEVFRARLLEIEQELVDATLLAAVADDLAGALDPGQLLPRLADHALRLCHAHAVGVELLDPQRGVLELAAAAELGRRPIVAPAVPADATLAGRALAGDSTIELTGEEAERQGARYAPDPDTRVRALLAVPLTAAGERLGALVFTRTAPRPFAPAEVRRAQQLAGRAATAVRNARAHAALRRQLADLREGQAEIVQAEKLAALGKLGAGAAHEINNPLAAIVGNAELLLRREPLTAAAQQRVERILEAAYRAARVIRQLLAAVRPQPLDLAPTDVAAVLREAVAARRRDLALDGIQVIDELAALPSIPADGRQLAQAFGNILDNAHDAVKAIAPGEGRTIRLESRALPGRIRLRIENAGLPITDESLPRIFDPFFTTKAVGRGAGLGLSVCQGIVSAHGGRIFAENLPAGVAIVLELPAPAAGPGPPAPA